MDGAELLVARQHLAGFTVHLLKDREVADEVEQVGGAQQAGHRALLAVQRGARAALRCWPLFRRAEEERPPRALGLLGPQRRQLVRGLFQLGCRRQHA